jgi:pantetheine-phosphate adenylyltransferase
MKKAIFCGTFDPMTSGHMDIIARSAQQFEQLIVAVMTDVQTKTCMSADLRMTSVIQACAALPQVTVMPFSGLLVTFAEQQGVHTIIRSLRSADDFQYEYRMSVMNHAMHAGMETLFLMSSPAVSAISSTLVRQILAHGGDVREFVPQAVLPLLAGVVWR